MEAFWKGLAVSGASPGFFALNHPGWKEKMQARGWRREASHYCLLDRTVQEGTGNIGPGPTERVCPAWDTTPDTSASPPPTHTPTHLGSP